MTVSIEVDDNSQPTLIALGLGSNLGDREGLLDQAVLNLEKRGVEVCHVSSWIETPPVDCPPGSPNFLNGALTAYWPTDVFSLHRVCREVEILLGRQRGRQRNTPRSIDIDILVFGDAIIDTPELTVPHPRMCQRLFVLEPLCEIAPTLQIPPENLTVAHYVEQQRSIICSFQ
ncbi:MAG: 2-amino-4-hydroxy-6-hydroxymethyldihydropteridine diphosphokinase [Lentisphaerae bacterium]|nr:MAG: 2-amino-4-hydroxy-6-hydroxymethyldihydropteridine diphosphokinase [Lentisphaerota bacterium]